MKALTLWQPWASAIPLGLKRVETRPPWAMRLRSMIGEDVAVHAAVTRRPLAELHKAAALGDEHAELLLTGVQAGDPDMSPLDDLPTGCVVAVVRIAAVERTDTITWVPDGGIGGDLPYGLGQDCMMLTERQRPWGDYEPGRVAIVLDNVRPLDAPVACRGFQQLWTLPDDVHAMVQRGLLR